MRRFDSRMMISVSSRFMESAEVVLENSLASTWADPEMAVSGLRKSWAMLALIIPMAASFSAWRI